MPPFPWQTAIPTQNLTRTLPLCSFSSSWCRKHSAEQSSFPHEARGPHASSGVTFEICPSQAPQERSRPKLPGKSCNKLDVRSTDSTSQSKLFPALAHAQAAGLSDALPGRFILSSAYEAPKDGYALGSIPSPKQIVVVEDVVQRINLVALFPSGFLCERSIRNVSANGVKHGKAVVAQWLAKETLQDPLPLK